MKFLFLIYADESAWSESSRAEQQGILDAHANFRAEAEAAGKYVDEQMLQPTTHAVRIRKREGKYRRKDGPFEGSEQLGGCYVFDCDDLDEAIRWAAKLPEVRTGSIVIREIVPDIPGL